MNLISLIIISTLSFYTFSQKGNEPLNLTFNRVYYYAPGNQILETESEIIKASSYITIDLEMNAIKIITYFSNPPTESTYSIKSLDNVNKNLYKFVCSASNYADIIIEVDIEKLTVTRKVLHNGILHQYYNE